MENISVFCDGGSRGNPGPAAIGFVVRIGKRIIYKHSEFIGKATNNIAEYTAVLRALEWLAKNPTKILDASLGLPARQGLRHQALAGGSSRVSLRNYSGAGNIAITFYLDSQLVVQQLKGSFKVKSPRLQKLAIKIKSLEKKLADLSSSKQLKIFYKKIPRQKNKLADSLVNFALDTLIN